MWKFNNESLVLSCLLAVEQNNELVMKNHRSYPIGSTSFPTRNVISFIIKKIVVADVYVVEKYQNQLESMYIKFFKYKCNIPPKVEPH